MKRALVIDDNDVNRLLVIRMLGKAGWQVAEADCGEAGISYLADHAVDVVFLDVSMPTMSGQEVCAMIRARGLGGGTAKVVAYTAHAMPEEVSGLLRDGFDSVLSKPVSRDRLTAVLADLGLSE